MITKKVYQIEIWKIEDATEEIEEKMKQTWFVITLCILLSITSGIVLSISYVIPTHQDNDFYGFSNWLVCIFHSGKLCLCGV